MALERAKSGPVSMCRACGVTATQSGAVKCTVCGATDFEVISREMIEKIAEVEGGLEEETTYDGRKLRWSEEARKGLWTMKNAYQRRRVKARVEKRARMKKLDAITLDFARQVIEEETGAPLDIKAPSAATANARGRRAAERSRRSGEARLIARDDKKNPLISTFDWTDDAAQRILRVPAGFMRNKTQERIEELARERARRRRSILALVEDGIEIGKQMMAEMIATYPSQGTSRRRAAARSRAAPAVAADATSLERASRHRPRTHRSESGYLNEVRSLSASRAGLIGCRRRVRRMSAYRFCRTDDVGASRRRAESLLVAVLSRRAADDAGRVQAVDPRPSGLVQQLHGRLLGLRPDRRPDRRQAAVRYPRPQDRRPSRSSATGSWPSPARPRSARSSRFSARRESSPKSPRRLAPACELFSASGYVQEAILTDYVLRA